MVSDVQDWQWSSYLAMVGGRSSESWLETGLILNHFGDSREAAIENYQNFVREGIGLSPVWSGLKKQVFLGDEQFIDEAIARIETRNESADLREVPRTQRRKKAQPLSWYEDNAPTRNEAIVNAYTSGDYSMKKIAEWFKVHYTTVSRVVRKIEKDDCNT